MVSFYLFVLVRHYQLSYRRPFFKRVTVFQKLAMFLDIKKIILVERVYKFVARVARVSREDPKRTAISLWS